MTAPEVAVGDVEVPEVAVGEPVRVKVHPALCEGWGECHRWGADVYPLDEEGHVDVHRLEVPAELAEQAFLGAAACPNQAISYLGPRPPRLAEEGRP